MTSPHTCTQHTQKQQVQTQHNILYAHAHMRPTAAATYILTMRILSEKLFKKWNLNSQFFCASGFGILEYTKMLVKSCLVTAVVLLSVRYMLLCIVLLCIVCYVRSRVPLKYSHEFGV